MSYDLLDPPEDEEEGETEEDTAEADAEAERLANWKANFPYKPTTDPDLMITEEMLIPSNTAEPPTANHCFLRSFFEDETKFTAQFEQLYHILEEHGRGNNPVVAGNILNCLWKYHEYSQKDPDELSGWRAIEQVNTRQRIPKLLRSSLKGSCIICMRKECGRTESLCLKAKQ